MMAVGAHGVISVAANVVPAEMKALVVAAASGEFAQAQAIHRKLWKLFRATFAEVNPVPIKCGVALLGRCGGETRLPLTPATDATRATMEACLRELGALS
jgi:4-hydroxy-tetrahydrodipicolinate synthase